jgi:hypothetical protein
MGLDFVVVGPIILGMSPPWGFVGLDFVVVGPIILRM